MAFDAGLLWLILASLILIALGLPVAFSLAICAFAYLWLNGFPLSVGAQELGILLGELYLSRHPVIHGGRHDHECRKNYR